jgi:hypothetical protein
VFVTRPPDVVARSIALHEGGKNATEVSEALGVPRRTVADWLSGRVPISLENSGVSPTRLLGMSTVIVFPASRTMSG